MVSPSVSPSSILDRSSSASRAVTRNTHACMCLLMSEVPLYGPQERPLSAHHDRLPKRKRIFIELMTSDRKLQASREGSK